MRKKEGSGAISYLFLFILFLLLTIVSMYLLQVGRLYTHRNHVDDALTDAVLGSLVADDVYYFETMEQSGTGVLRLRDTGRSYEVFTDCFMSAVGEASHLYKDVKIEEYITYEVEGSQVTVSHFSGDHAIPTVYTGSLGSVTVPGGKVVEKTSAYGKVSFTISTMFSDTEYPKAREFYCVLKTTH